MDIDASIWQGQKGRWAAPQHYMCSYMAMFPPELPHYFIERFTKPGDTVLDPFCGRGTAPVEAAAQNRIGIGNDLNPLAIALTRGKLSNPELNDVLARLNNLESRYDKSDWKYFSGAPKKIRMIYHINTLRQLMYLKRELDWSKPGVDAFIVAVLMGAMHGSSKGFLSLPMPNTFSMGWNYVKKYIAKHNLKRPNRDAFEVIRHRCKRFLKKGPLPGEGLAIHGDVRNLSESKEIANNSVKMIFSSPPYLKVIKYGLYNWIRLWWLIGEHKSIDDKLDDEHSIKPYLNFMKEVLETTLPLLDKKSGVACWVIGDVKDLNLAKLVWDEVGSKIEVISSDDKILKYRLLGIIADEIRNDEKVTKIWNSDTDKSGKATMTDRILIISPQDSLP